MSWKDDYGLARTYDFTVSDCANPQEVYCHFLSFLNAVYEWDTEKCVEALYAEEE